MTDEIVMDESGVALLRRVLFAAGRDPKARPILASVFFDGDAAFATDSYRMAVAWFEGRELPAAKCLSATLRSVLPRSGDWVSNGELEVVNAIPLNWRKIIGRCRWQGSIVFARETLLALPGTRRAPVTVALTPEGISERRDGEIARVAPSQPADFPAIAHDGSHPEPIWVNAMYLREAAKASRSDRITLDCDTNVTPIMLREPGLSQLIMPVHVA